MKWDDNLLLLNAPPERAQAQLAAYAVYLSRGATITAKAIKVDTIKQYVFSVASFLALFSGRDARYDSPSDRTFGTLLSPVYKDLERFETVPDRREPYTPEMHQEAERVATSYRQRDHRLLIPALTDGFAMGLMAGFRLAEWAQHSGFPDPLHPMLNHLEHPNIKTRALCPADVRVETVTHQRLSSLAILSVPVTSIRKIWIKFRTQKNGYHGEERIFTRNPDSGHCFVAAMYRSLTRFKDLQSVLPTLTDISPLSIYWDPMSKSVRSITATDIESFMRSLAVTVYDLHPLKDKKALQKWSAHSLRVGACVLLHAMGFSTLDIQWLLRWRSNAFMAYLRNLAGLADRQYAALDKAKGMPHLF